MTMVEISAIRSKSCDFEVRFVLNHDYDAEVRADRIGALKNLLHDVRGCVGRDIEIFSGQTPNHVAHGTAGKIRNVTALAQTLRDPAGSLFHGRHFHARIVAAVSAPPLTII